MTQIDPDSFAAYVKLAGDLLAFGKTALGMIPKAKDRDTPSQNG